MTVTLSRIIKYGWQAFIRNASLAVSTVSIMILAALVFEGLIISNVVGKEALSSIQQKIDISVYFKPTTEEDSILNVKKSLESLNEVGGVTYVSREDALEQFKLLHADDETISQTLDELDGNPLLSSINIKAKDPHEYDSIAKYLEEENLKVLIEKVDYAQNQVVIERLVGIIDTIRNGGITLTLFFAFLAAIIIFNTIRLAIFSNSEQIGIMRLVGASNTFIRGPYIIEGIIYGIIAAVVGFLVLVPLVGYLSPYVMRFIPEMNLSAYFQSAFLSLFFYQLLFSIGLGIISSTIAVRKYLHL